MPVRTLLFLFCWLPLLMPASTGDTIPEKKAAPPQKTREVRNYIRPCFYFDNFSTGQRKITGPQTIVNNRLGKYTFAQTNVGFYTPLMTRTRFAGADSTDVNTFHLLLTFNALGDRPEFAGLEKQHRLFKTGIGLRGIYTFGSQFVLFADAFPFATGDHYDKQNTQSWRFGGTVVFNYMISPKFSIRAGATKNYLFGNRRYLPMAGFRVGALDSKCYFTFQFPRHMALYIQPGPKFSMSIFSRVYGSLYNFSNKDSIYLGNDKSIQMGYTGLANGIRFDFRPGPNFSFFLSSGFAVQNHIWFYSYSFNQQNGLRPLAHFYDGRPDPTIFLHFGLSVRFGKSKRSAGNYLMYDVFDLNNSLDPGDNNSGPGNGDIPRKQKMKNVQYKDVVDLVDETDLY